MKICVIINSLQAKNAARNKIIEYAVETKERTMRALISVSDKTGVVELAKELEALGIELISTGGTYKKLAEAGVKAMEISELTGFPECLDGRVKTLHPVVHAGLLAMRSNPEHMKQLKELGIEPIDLVIVNLYPFKATILKDGVTRAEAVENIDIGGPTMLRAAAKNYQDVAVVTDPSDYEKILAELKADGQVSLDTKFYLMQKVFMHTSSYDTMIADYLKKERGDDSLPETLTMHSRIHSYERFILIFFQIHHSIFNIRYFSIQSISFFLFATGQYSHSQYTSKKHIYHSFHLYLPYYYNSSKINIPMQLCKLHRSYLEINSP